MPEEFSTIHEIHDEVKLLVRLEGIVKVDNEWILYFLEDFSLG